MQDKELYLILFGDQKGNILESNGSNDGDKLQLIDKNQHLYTHRISNIYKLTKLDKLYYELSCSSGKKQKEKYQQMLLEAATKYNIC